MTDDTNDQGAQGVDKQEKTGSMLDINKVKAAAGGDGTDEQGAQDKTVQLGADGKAIEKKGDADQPGQKQTRPEWLTEDKFWDAEKGEPKYDLMFKNLQELQTKFSKGDHKAPEKPEAYKVTLDEKQKELLFGAKDADPHKDPLFKQATGWAAKHKISQAAFDEFLGMYADVAGAETSKFQIDAQAEYKALGKNADAIIQNQHDFFQQMFKNGEIGEAELKEASILFETAAGVKLVQAIRTRYGEQSIPTNPAPDMDGVPSSEELAKMRLDDKYEKDADFRKKVDGWYDKRYGTKPAMSSVVNR